MSDKPINTIRALAYSLNEAYTAKCYNAASASDIRKQAELDAELDVDWQTDDSVIREFHDRNVMLEHVLKMLSDGHGAYKLTSVAREQLSEQDAKCSAYSWDPIRLERFGATGSWWCDRSFAEDQYQDALKAKESLERMYPNSKCRIIELSFSVLKGPNS